MEELKQQHDNRENQQQDLIAKQQSHITALAGENTQLKSQVEQALTDKEDLQKEVLKQSDYIVSVQEKCYQSNKQSLEILESLKDAEDEIEVLKSYIVDLKCK